MAITLYTRAVRLKNLVPRDRIQSVRRGARRLYKMEERCSSYHHVGRSLLEGCADGVLRSTLQSPVVSALEYLSDGAKSSGSSSLGPGKLRPSSRRERRSGGALPTLQREGREALSALRSKSWNATLGLLAAQDTSSFAGSPPSTPTRSPQMETSAARLALCARAPVAEALVLTHLVLVEIECVEHVLAQCLLEVDAALADWQKRHGSGPIEHALKAVEDGPADLLQPTPRTTAGEAILKLSAIWNQKVRLLGRLERYAQQLRWIWEGVTRRCLWDNENGCPRMEEDEYLGRVAAAVLFEQFNDGASPVRGESDAECVAGILAVLFDAMIVVEDALGLSNSIKLLEETNAQLSPVDGGSGAEDDDDDVTGIANVRTLDEEEEEENVGPNLPPRTPSASSKLKQLGKTYAQIAHHRACVESQLLHGGAQEAPRRLPRSLQGVVVVPSRGKITGGEGKAKKARRAPFSLITDELRPSQWTTVRKIKAIALCATAVLGSVAIYKNRAELTNTAAAVGAFFVSHVVEPIQVIIEEVFESQRGTSISDESAIVDAKVSMRNMLAAYYTRRHPDMGSDALEAKLDEVDMSDVSRDYEGELLKPAFSVNPRAETMVNGNAPQLLLMQVRMHELL